MNKNTRFSEVVKFVYANEILLGNNYSHCCVCSNTLHIYGMRETLRQKLIHKEKLVPSSLKIQRHY